MRCQYLYPPLCPYANNYAKTLTSSSNLKPFFTTLWLFSEGRANNYFFLYLKCSESGFSLFFCIFQHTYLDNLVGYKIRNRCHTCLANPFCLLQNRQVFFLFVAAWESHSDLTYVASKSSTLNFSTLENIWS